jgi:hypothetical protein
MRGRAGIIVSLCVVVLVPASGCGGNDGPSQAELNQARRDAARQQLQEDRLKALEQKLKEKTGTSAGGSTTAGGASGGTGGSGGATSGGRACGGGLTAGPNTTCAFAQVVRDAYRSHGAGTFTAHSPVTGLDYTITCGGRSPHVCTGGNNASVYFP